jgi:hypothetical protein
MVGVADRHGQRVGGVGGGDGAAGQQQADHRLHLRLVRPALPDDGLFDHVVGVFRHRQTSQRRNQQRHRARLPQLQGGRGVGVDEGLLDRRLVRGVSLQHRRQGVVKLDQTLGQGATGVGMDRAVGDVGQAVADDVNDAPPGVAQARVDPQQTNRRWRRRSVSSGLRKHNPAPVRPNSSPIRPHPFRPRFLRR